MIPNVLITIRSTDAPLHHSHLVCDFLDYVLLLAKVEFGDVEGFDAVITYEGSTLRSRSVDFDREIEISDLPPEELDREYEEFQSTIARFVEEVELEIMEYSEFVSPTLSRR